MKIYLELPASKSIIKSFIEYCTPNRTIEHKEELCEMIFRVKNTKNIIYTGNIYIGSNSEFILDAIMFHPILHKHVSIF